MDSIKGIRKIKNNHYQLTTEKGKKITVSEDVLVKRRLLKGEEISPELLDLIKKEAELDIGYQLALSYLSYQLRSEKEMRDYLTKKEISPEGIDYVVKKLTDLALIDDMVFAESYVRTVIKTQDKGPQLIKQALIKKGIKNETIDQALVLFTEDEQEQLATRLANKALHKYRAKSYKEQLNKIKQHLFVKGYSSEVIQWVMANLEVEKSEGHEWEILVTQGEKLWRKNARLDDSKKKQKIKQALFQKGFDFDAINRFIEGKERSDDE